MKWLTQASIGLVVWLWLGVTVATAGNNDVRVRVLSRYHPSDVHITTVQGTEAILNARSTYPVGFPAGPRYRIHLPDVGETRFYSGAIEAWWEGNEIVLINQAPLEDYVAGVVVSELGVANPAAMRAQAVIARTWALRHRTEEKKYSFGDLANHQVFHGFSEQAEQAKEQLAATQGLVLLHDARPIDAVYHAECADRVYSAREIWGGNGQDYLSAVSLPEAIADTQERRWVRRLPREKVDRLFHSGSGQYLEYQESRRDGVLGIQVIPGEWFGVDRFRLTIERALGWNTLRSNAFTIFADGDDLIFRGEGFGHLVGLCQVQAGKLGERGWRFEEILHLFYPGTQLKTMQDF